MYSHRNTHGEIVSYSGRDLSFEAKWQEWLRKGKPEGKKPNKHRYVKGYHRGLELYGGHASRLDEEHVPASLEQRGLVVVEGMNEVLRMDSLGVCAVGLGSTTATDAQITTLASHARSVAGNRITLLPDCDEAGEAGFKELLWRLAEARVQTKLAVSRKMFEGKFAGRQPEDLSEEEWSGLGCE